MMTGHRALAALLGVVEVTVWIFAVGWAVKYLDQPWAVVGYASGFGLGIVLGMMLEERLALGHRLVRVIANSAEPETGERPQFFETCYRRARKP